MWTLSDVLILRCVGGHDRATGSPLRGVIATADYLDHAVPLEEEFTGAVGRLLGAGLLECDVAADRYWLTAAGRLLAERRGRSAVKPADLERLDLPAGGAWSLPAGTYRAAVDAYLA